MNSFVDDQEIVSFNFFFSTSSNCTKCLTHLPKIKTGIISVVSSYDHNNRNKGLSKV